MSLFRALESGALEHTIEPMKRDICYELDLAEDASYAEISSALGSAKIWSQKPPKARQLSN